MIVEDGSLRLDRDGWTLTRPLSTGLPDTIQGVIASRLDLLPPGHKRVVQDAAVVGRIFWAGAIAQLGDSTALAALPELLDKGLVRERETSAIAGEREFMFNHILIRDVAYASVPRRRRREAHGEVVAWLEGIVGGREETLAETLWYQASEAGDDRRSARYAMHGGRRLRRDAA
jgi:predicted ATPase